MKKLTGILICMLLVMICTISLAESRAIPAGTAIYNGHEYTLFYGKKTWHEAKRLCEKMGGHLVTINSKGEQKFIKKLIRGADRQIDNYWIGLTDEGHEGNWNYWITGEPVTYSHWNPGNPDGGSYQNYGGIAGRTYCEDGCWSVELGEWDDKENNNRHVGGFICEWETIDDD